MKNLIIVSQKPGPPARPPLRLVPPHAAAAGPLAALDALNPARRYLATLAAPSRRSMRVNLNRVARLLGVPFDGVPWHLLRAPHLEALRAAMADARLSPATTNATLAALRGVAKQAFALRALGGDDYQLIREVRGVRGGRVGGRARPVAVPEVARLLDACARDPTAAGRRDACLVALLAGAGLRRAEAAALTLADWRARSHALRVVGKGDRERLVYLEDGGTRRALRAWLEVRGDAEGPLLTPVDRRGRVQFRHLTGDAVYNALRKRRREAGLRQKFSPHALRHFFATHLLEAGANIVEVSELLGHASIEVTAVYAHSGERGKRRAASLISLPYRSGGGGRGRRRRQRKGRRRS